MKDVVMGMNPLGVVPKYGCICYASRVGWVGSRSRSLKLDFVIMNSHLITTGRDQIGTYQSTRPEGHWHSVWDKIMEEKQVQNV